MATKKWLERLDDNSIERAIELLNNKGTKKRLVKFSLIIILLDLLLLLISIRKRKK